MVQVSPHHQTDLGLVEYMHDAVACPEWAQIAVTQCAASDMLSNIHKLYAGLGAAWLQHEKFTQAEKDVHLHKAVSEDISVVL